MFCTNCGNEVREGVTFCFNCGLHLGDDSAWYSGNSEYWLGSTWYGWPTYVTLDGSIRIVGKNGDECIGVRPAIWVKLDK